MDKHYIRRVNGYGKNGYMYYPVVVIGAGESGIAAAYKLQHELGFTQYRVFERQSGVGGTWYINRYPGVACDVPAIFYSFSFAPNPRWTTFYPSGPEIYSYLEDVCNKHALTDKFQLNTDVTECVWLKDEEVWEITIRHLAPGIGDLSDRNRNKKIEEEGINAVILGEEKIRTKILLSAVGGLVEPKGWPDNIPGLDKFQGKMFHSARWDYNVDLHNKDVVVVGTGCSAAQFVPQLTKRYGAKSVTQLMRSPPWVVDRHPTPGGDALWYTYAPILFSNIPGFLKFVRFCAFTRAEYDFRFFGGGKLSAWHREKEEKRQVARMKKIVPAKYHAMLTPNYGIGCKRRIFDATWFPGLNDPKIDLTTQPLKGLGERSVVLGQGQHYPKSETSPAQREIPADVIVLANGFETYKWLHPLKIVGKQGKNLVDVMDERGGPQAYLGTAMDGFPNFFIIFGPNTATGHSSVIMASENMANHAMKFVKQVLNGDATTVEVKQEAEVAYTRDIQRRLKNSVWQSGGCMSWYFDKNGWNSTMCPYSQVWLWWRCFFPYYWHWNISYTRKGMFKLVVGRIFKLFGLFYAIRAFLSYRRNKAEAAARIQALISDRT